MTRLPEATRDALPEQLREAFDELVAANDGKVPTGGPARVTINSPEMARRRRPLTSYLRFETEIPERLLELAILTSARCLDCPYVWNAHAPAARRTGISDALIDALRDNKPLPAMRADESAVVQFGTQLFKTPPRQRRHLRGGPGPIRSPAARGPDGADGLLRPNRVLPECVRGGPARPRGRAPAAGLASLLLVRGFHLGKRPLKRLGTSDRWFSVLDPRVAVSMSSRRRGCR